MKKSPPSLMKWKHVINAIVIFLFLWGIALRSVEVVTGNFLFGTDHGRDYLAAYNIVENHKLTLIGAEAGSGVAGINGIFHGPGYFYAIASAYALFQGDPYGGQLFMVLSGIFAMFVAWWVGTRICGRVGGILTLFFAAISPLIVSQSRFIWSSHPLTGLVILSMYCVFLAIKRPRLFAPLAVFLAALTYHFQLGVAVPLIMGILLAFIFAYRIRDIKTYVFSFLALVLAISPMILFEARHNFMAVRSFIQYVTIGGGGSSLFEAARLREHVLFYWYNFYNTFTFEFAFLSGTIQRVILYIALIPVSIGLLRTKDRTIRKFVGFIIITILVTWVSYLLLNNVVWDYYLTHVRIGFIFLFSIGGSALVFHSKGKLGRILAILFGIFLLSMVSGTIFRMIVTYTIDFVDYGGISKIQGKRDAIDTIYRDAGGKEFSVMTYVPSIYSYPYDYLFLTYGKKKYGYSPQQFGYQPQTPLCGTVYLLIEPVGGDPLWLSGWLSTVVGGGMIDQERFLPSGHQLIRKIYQCN